MCKKQRYHKFKVNMEIEVTVKVSISSRNTFQGQSNFWSKILDCVSAVFHVFCVFYELHNQYENIRPDVIRHGSMVIFTGCTRFSDLSSLTCAQQSHDVWERSSCKQLFFFPILRMRAVNSKIYHAVLLYHHRY